MAFYLDSLVGFFFGRPRFYWESFVLSSFGLSVSD